MNGRSAATPSQASQFEPGRDGVVAVGPGVLVAPVLAAPAMDLLHLADRPRLDGRDDRPVDRVRVDLDAHLRDEPLLAAPPGSAAGPRRSSA